MARPLARQEITLILRYSGIARKIPNDVTANHERGGINKRRGGFNNSLIIITNIG